MRAFHARIFASLLIGVSASATGAENSGGFYALFYDGSHVSVPTFSQDVWWSDKAVLAGRPLFGTQNPVRMLQNLAPWATLKGPRVVMANGDVVPGKIVGFLPASPADDTSARLVISLDGSLITSDPRGLAVRADRVVRVTSAADGTGADEPGSLVLTNGSRLTASAVRWGDQGLKALTASGLTAVSFDAIWDLSVPRVDLMPAVLDDSLYPPLGPRVVIGRLETIQGAVLTYCREMTLVGASKASRSSNYLLVQPSWSSGVILVPMESIWRQSFRAAREVPLSLLPATTLHETVGLHRWPWRRNENVEGDTLASGTITVDLGVGMHSGCEVAFDLPLQARQFTALAGLDRRIAPGACATCKIYLDQLADRPLFSSSLLYSGQEPIRVGPLLVSGGRRLALVTQWAGTNRPQDAYPLDIGGHVDWLMPFVTIEPDDASYCESLRRFVPGWTTWDLDPADARRVRVGACWDVAHEGWLPVIHVTAPQPLTIHRGLSPVSSANDRLELIFAHGKDAPLPAIELRVDGELAASTLGRDAKNSAQEKRLPVQAKKVKVDLSHGPARQAAGSLAETAQDYQVRTMRWDLHEYRGRSVQLTLTISLDKQPRGLVWRALAARPATGNQD